MLVYVYLKILWNIPKVFFFVFWVKRFILCLLNLDLNYRMCGTRVGSICNDAQTNITIFEIPQCGLLGDQGDMPSGFPGSWLFRASVPLQVKPYSLNAMIFSYHNFQWLPLPNLPWKLHVALELSWLFLLCSHANLLLPGLCFNHWDFCFWFIQRLNHRIWMTLIWYIVS